MAIAEFEPSHLVALSAITRASSAISGVGCLFIILHSLFVSCPNFSARLIVWLSCANLVQAVGMSLSQLPIGTDYCQLQGAVVHFGGLASVFWTCAFALSHYVVAVRRTWRYETLGIKLHAVCWGVPLCNVCAVWLANGYGDDVLWCTIPLSKTVWWWCTFYMYVVCAVVFVVFCFYHTLVGITHHLRDVIDLETTMAIQSTSSRQLHYYVGCFVFVWVWALLDRCFTLATHRHSLTLAVLHVTFVPSQGFFNAVLYGKLVQKLFELNCTPNRESSLNAPVEFSPANKSLVFSRVFRVGGIGMPSRTDLSQALMATPPSPSSIQTFHSNSAVAHKQVKK